MAKGTAKTTATSQAATIKTAARPAAKPPFEPESDLWVTLRDLPSDYCHDEALLLCEEKEGEWVSWIPGYGEITLNRSQFHY